MHITDAHYPLCAFTGADCRQWEWWRDCLLPRKASGKYLSCWAEVTISTMKKPPTCSLPSPIPAVRSDCPTKVRHHMGGLKTDTWTLTVWITIVWPTFWVLKANISCLTAGISTSSSAWISTWLPRKTMWKATLRKYPTWLSRHKITLVHGWPTTGTLAWELNRYSKWAILASIPIWVAL